MTQSLSNLMNEASVAILILVGLLLLLGLCYRWYRQRIALEQSLPEGKNHPTIPTRFYKLSELKAEGTGCQAEQSVQSVPMRALSTSDTYSIPPDLWDV